MANKTYLLSQNHSVMRQTEHHRWVVGPRQLASDFARQTCEFPGSAGGQCSPFPRALESILIR